MLYLKELIINIKSVHLLAFQQNNSLNFNLVNIVNYLIRYINAYPVIVYLLADILTTDIIKKYYQDTELDVLQPQDLIFIIGKLTSNRLFSIRNSSRKILKSILFFIKDSYESDHQNYFNNLNNILS